MVRTPCCDKTGVKKGAWTAEEDSKLIGYIKRYGCWNWRRLPKYAGLSRCGKSCRLRWLNYLRPNIKRGNYSKEEEETIIKLHESLGNRWSVIAAQLPGRTDNEIKNHWHTNLKKRLKQNSIGKNAKLDSNELSQSETSEGRGPELNNSLLNIPASHKIIESSSLSPQSSSSEFSSLTTDTSVVSGTNYFVEDNVAPLDTYAEPSGNFWTEPFLADNYCITNDFQASLVDPGFLFQHSPISDGEFLCPYGLYDERCNLNW